ncbi:MAG: 3'-5' exonuclease, partial [Clostridiales bacterium]|nr:3'-5' exonuclease [Clostridiales bacterium]
WLGRISEVYDFDLDDGLDNMPIIKYYLDEYKSRMAEFCGSLRAATEELEQLDKPEKFLAMAGEEISMLENALNEEDPAKAVRAMAGFAFGRAPSRSKDLSQKEIQDKYINIRDRVKAFCKDAGRIIASLNDAEGLRTSLDDLRPFINILVRLTRSYMTRLNDKKRERNIITFNDMEHFALNILVRRENGSSCLTRAAEDLKEFYQEILVDEYQDSNSLQEEILNAIAKTDNRYMVGDVKQSIYSFRKARPSIFIEKYNSFSSDYEDKKDTKIILKKNFRSRARVLRSVNEIFNKAMQSGFSEVRYDTDAQLIPGADFPEPSPLQNTFSDVQGKSQIDLVDIEEDDERDWIELEALITAKRIKELIDRKYYVYDRNADAGYRPLQYKDIVILTRKERGVTRSLVDVLLDQGVPVHAESKGSYLENYELRPLISMLQIIDNPLDDVAFAGSMVSFFGGFTLDELAVIRIYKKQEYLYKNMLDILDQAGNDSLDGTIYPPELLKKIRNFKNLLEDQAQAALNANMYDILWHLVYDTGYYAYINTMPAADKRLANIDMLINRAEVFSGTSYNGLFQFLRYIEKIREADEELGEVSTLSENENVVRVMSIHKSKGLEFPVVFLIGIDRSFNFMDTKARLAVQDDLGAAMDNIYEKRRLVRNNVFKEAIVSRIRKDTINEELRLLYVALTRAKEKLFLIGSRNIFANKDAKEIYKGNYAETNSGSHGNREQVSYLALNDHYRKNFYSVYDRGVFGLNDMYGIKTYMDVCLPAALKSDDKVFDINIMPSSSLHEATAKPATGIRTETIKEVTKIKRLEDREPYAFENEIHLKPKVTVTELKTMRMEEMEEGISYRLPEAVGGKGKGGRSSAGRGIAYHKVMELLDYERTGSLESIRAQSADWLDEGLIDEEDLALVRLEDIALFVASPAGIKAAQAFREGRLRREQEFMIGLEEDGRTDMLIVQGTIDMYIEEEDGFILMDYKTDRVPEGQASILADRYKVQMDYYARALTQVSDKPVKEKIIYSFALGLAINI